MCKNCWENAGSPSIVNERTRNAANLIDAVYSFDECISGGGLHIQLDDLNLKDRHFDSECLSFIDKDECSEECRRAQLACFHTLALLSEQERYSALALSNGWFDDPEAPPRDRMDEVAFYVEKDGQEFPVTRAMQEEMMAKVIGKGLGNPLDLDG